MKLDMVHDIQAAYRTVLDCMARPGKKGSLKERAEKIDIDTICLKTTALLMLMLMDTEVAFKIVSKKENEITRLVNRLTYAKAEETRKADYVYILLDSTKEELADALETCSAGDLTNPHKSAFVILEAESLGGHENLEFSGPGIKNANRVSINAGNDWIDIRSKKNCEYPLGIDMIFTDREGSIVCVPRTTRIKRI